MSKPKTETLERRNFGTTLELRSEDNSPTVVRGTGALFNILSEDLGGFREKIAEGAFDDVLGDDVRALFDHKGHLILGRTKSGTLKIWVDQRGLNYEYEDPDTSYSRDLIKSMERGDVDQSSFGFYVGEDRWDEIDGVYHRTILKVSRLLDVSPVTYPAYTETSVAKRSLDSFKESAATPPKTDFNNLEIQKRKLNLLKLKSGCTILKD